MDRHTMQRRDCVVSIGHEVSGLELVACAGKSSAVSVWTMGRACVLSFERSQCRPEDVEICSVPPSSTAISTRIRTRTFGFSVTPWVASFRWKRSLASVVRSRSKRPTVPDPTQQLMPRVTVPECSTKTSSIRAVFARTLAGRFTPNDSRYPPLPLELSLTAEFVVHRIEV